MNTWARAFAPTPVAQFLLSKYDLTNPVSFINARWRVAGVARDARSQGLACEGLLVVCMALGYYGGFCMHFFFMDRGPRQSQRCPGGRGTLHFHCCHSTHELLMIYGRSRGQCLARASGAYRCIAPAHLSMSHPQVVFALHSL